MVVNEQEFKKYTLKAKKDIEDIWSKKYVEVPKEIKKARGIKLSGRKTRSLLNTTDPVILRNNNADAGLIVYPFTPEPLIIQSFIQIAHMPLIIGVGGGTTKGDRIAQLALNADFMGATAVIVNSPITQESLKKVTDKVNIPVIATVVSEKQVEEKINAGAHVINVSAGKKTPQIVEKIDDNFSIPITATGGPNPKTILNTIQKGARAISYTPPDINALMHELMEKYRKIGDPEIHG